MRFSMQVSTVMYEHVKCASRFLRERHGLRYNGFVVLLCLMEAARPVGVDELSDYLMLQKETVLALLIDLEDAGWVAKEGAEGDARFMRCTLTGTGRALVRRAASEVSQALSEAFLVTLPMEEFVLFADIDAATAAFRGRAVSGFGATAPGTLPPKSRDYLFPSGHYLYWRVLIDRWKRALREDGAVTFDEFRILDFVRTQGAASLGRVAHALRLQRSGLSVYKAGLVRAGLLVERRDPFDGRSVIVRCMPEGERLVERLTPLLDVVSAAAHEGLSERDEIVLDAWYMRMYSNMLASDDK